MLPSSHNHFEISWAHFEVCFSIYWDIINLFSRGSLEIFLVITQTITISKYFFQSKLPFAGNHFGVFEEPFHMFLYFLWLVQSFVMACCIDVSITLGVSTLEKKLLQPAPFCRGLFWGTFWSILVCVPPHLGNYVMFYRKYMQMDVPIISPFSVCCFVCLPIFPDSK